MNLRTNRGWTKPLSRIEGTLWWSDPFSRNCHRFCGVSDRSVQTFYSRKRGLQGDMSRLAVWRSPVWNYKLLENERKTTVPNRRIYRFTGKSGEVHSLKVCQLVIALKMARAKVLGVFVFGLQRSFLAHFWLQKESGKNRQTLKALGPASCLNGIGWSGFASFKRKSWSSEIMIFRFHVKLQCVPKTKFLSCIL